MSDSERLRTAFPDLPDAYLRAVAAGPWERDFLDGDERGFYTFILFSEDEVLEYQPDPDQYVELAGLVAIGGDGGGGTYLLRTSDGSIWSADLISPEDSLERVAGSIDELLGMLAPDEGADSA